MIYNKNSIHLHMVCSNKELPFFSSNDRCLGSSPFPGQFIRSDPQSGQLSYAETVGYYTDEIGNGVDPLQQHHPSQNYSHLQQR